MSDVETTRIRETKRILNFFAEDFTTYLASTIAVTEKLPDEVNNQIRNAFTHLVRVDRAVSIEQVETESKLAIRHIERANRDCLKVSIIFARERLESLVADVFFYHGFLAPNLKQAYSHIALRRKDAYRGEASGDENHTKALEEILVLTLDLSDGISQAYSVAGKPKTRFLRSVMRWSRPVFYILAVALGILLKSIFDHFFPGIIGPTAAP